FSTDFADLADLQLQKLFGGTITSARALRWQFPQEFLAVAPRDLRNLWKVLLDQAVQSSCSFPCKSVASSCSCQTTASLHSLLFGAKSFEWIGMRMNDTNSFYCGRMRIAPLNVRTAMSAPPRPNVTRTERSACETGRTCANPFVTVPPTVERENVAAVDRA